MPAKLQSTYSMPFAWSEVGPGPAADEFEVSVFGPGFGECIVVHVGSGEWLIIDSCVDTTDREDSRPVAERYLRAIGVTMETQVKFIVASHWHDDHVRGLARLVEVCREARFSCANALLQKEFFTFVGSLSTGTIATDGAKVKEFRQVLAILKAGTNRPPIRFATGSKELIAWHKPPGASVRLRSLSPSDHEFALFLQRMQSEMPIHGQPNRSAARSTPNLASVVLHLDLGDGSVLFGADMEIHHDTRRGWTAVLGDAATCNASASSLFKVAHHGSSTGHHEQVWSTMLLANPICVVTPFNKLPLGKKLPTKDDVERIRSLGRLFLTSQIEGAGRSRVRDAAVVRSLKENGIALREMRSPIGLVRMRRTVASGTAWRPETFGPATEI